MKLGRGCHRRMPWWCWAILLLVAAAAFPGASFVDAGEDRSPVADGQVRGFPAGAVNRFASGVGPSSEAGLSGRIALDMGDFEVGRATCVSILGPVTAGGEIRSDPPSDGRILEALAKSKRRDHWPFLHEETRSHVRIVKDKIAEYNDLPSAVPLLGKARLHHILYKCTVYSTQRFLLGWPVPQQTIEESAEVVYLDHCRYCLVGEGRTRSTAAETGDEVDATEAAP